MKIAKWFMVAACVLFCAACAKNDPLAYVEADADEVFYLNNTEDLDPDLWELFMESNFYKFTTDFKSKLFGVDMKENPAKMALWITYDRSRKKGTLSFAEKSRKMVIVFEEFEASDFLNQAKRHWEKDNGKYGFIFQAAERSQINSKEALILQDVTQHRYHTEKKVKATIIAYDKHVVQIFFDDDVPTSVLQPKKACKMVKDFDRDALYGKGESESWYTFSSSEHEKFIEEIRSEDDSRKGEKRDKYIRLDAGARIRQFFLKGDQFVKKTTQVLK